MAVTEELYSMTCNMLLDDGTTATGARKTVKQTLGRLNPEAWDAEKALAIVSRVKNCLRKAVVTVRQAKETDLSS